jgi:EmrB/QacA subfamily drug resistance transporter
MMGTVLASLEATVIVTAMPTVVSTLGGLDLYSWVYTIYLLSSTVSGPLWGRLSDLHGRRPFYLAGLSFFVGGSALAGLSRSMLQLVVFRGVQGLGAGALIPLGMTILGDIYSLEERGRIQGFLSGVWGVSAVVGPLLGGWITDAFSWRWVFFLNLPFGLLGGAIMATALREPPAVQRRRLDYAGAALLVVGAALLLLSLDFLGKGGSTAGRWLLLTTSVVLLTCFVWYEWRCENPILPMRLFRDRMFLAASVNAFLTGMSIFGAISFLPLFVQGVLGTGATEAGWALSPLTWGWVVFSIVSGRMILRVGYRSLVVTGMAALSLGFWLLSGADASISQPTLIFLMVCVGMGMGLSTVALLIAVQNRVPRHLLGISTSAASFFRSIGAAIGIAVMGAVMSRQMTLQLANFRSLKDNPQLAYFAGHPDAIVHPVARGGVPVAVLNQLQGVLQTALAQVFTVGFAIALAALAASFLVPAGAARDHAIRR